MAGQAAPVSLQLPQAGAVKKVEPPQSTRASAPVFLAGPRALAPAAGVRAQVAPTTRPGASPARADAASGVWPRPILSGAPLPVFLARPGVVGSPLAERRVSLVVPAVPGAARAPPMLPAASTAPARAATAALAPNDAAAGKAVQVARLGPRMHPTMVQPIAIGSHDDSIIAAPEAEGSPVSSTTAVGCDSPPALEASRVTSAGSPVVRRLSVAIDGDPLSPRSVAVSNKSGNSLVADVVMTLSTVASQTSSPAASFVHVDSIPVERGAIEEPHSSCHKFHLGSGLLSGGTGPPGTPPAEQGGTAPVAEPPRTHAATEIAVAPEREHSGSFLASLQRGLSGMFGQTPESDGEEEDGESMGVPEDEVGEAGKLRKSGAPALHGTVRARRLEQKALAEFVQHFVAGDDDAARDACLADGVIQTSLQPFSGSTAADVAGQLLQGQTEEALPWRPWLDEDTSDEEDDEEEDEGDAPDGRARAVARGAGAPTLRSVADDTSTEEGTDDRGTDDRGVGGSRSARARGGAQVFTPREVRRDVCIFFVHGGCFQYGSAADPCYSALCSRLASGSGLVVVCPDHPLAGEGRPQKAPEILRWLFDSLLWVMSFDPVSAEERRAPPGIILAGDSSGGNQAMSLLQLLAQERPEALALVKGVAMISPWLDLSCGSPTYVSNSFSPEAQTGDIAFRAPADRNRAEFRENALLYVGDRSRLTESLYSPYWLAREPSSDLRAVLEAARVPIWMCVGSAETLAGEALDFAQRLRNRLPVEVWLHDAMFHVWVMYSSEHPFPSRDAAMRNLVDFIGRPRRASGSAAEALPPWWH
mmetsp:Transcript_119313/g.382412  ORF Transcript_119313/g.382412 Transcript_119313/m.382412 type:complete len:817 (-) Transcript_119313:123-2573(-)